MNDPLIISSPDRREQAREAGRMAFRAGLPHHENPYMDHLSIHWSIGWIESQTEHNHSIKIIIDEANK